MIPEVDPASLRRELDGPHPPCLLDVREADELQISRLPDVVHIPLGDLPHRLPGLDPRADWVVVCRVGARSARATAFLLDQGFSRVRNLAGGMNAYAEIVDPEVAVY